MRLTNKHALLADRIVAGDKYIDAAHKAGYKGPSAGKVVSRALKDEKFLKMLDDRRAIMRERADKALPEYTPEYILMRLGQNEKLAVELGKLNESNKALELIAKAKGMFVTVTREERPRDVQFFRDITGAGNFKQIEPKESTNDKQDNNAGIGGNAEHSGPAGPRGSTVYQ